MDYVLLAYGSLDGPPGAIDAAIAALLERPSVTGWARLYGDESATTLRSDDAKTLLTDGPFIDSKEFLGGLILVEAGNLDGALAIAAELAELRPARVVAIEVRPVRGEETRGA